MAMPSKPWYRASKGTWYCTLNGKKVSLGVRGLKNSRAAREAWHKLMAEGKKEVNYTRLAGVGSLLAIAGVAMARAGSPGSGEKVGVGNKPGSVDHLGEKVV